MYQGTGKLGMKTVLEVPPEYRQCLSYLLLPANEVCEGYVFTGVCLSTGGCVCPIACWDTHPPGRHPPGQTHPPAHCMLGYGQQAGGTHPTGMHSCFINRLTDLTLRKITFSKVGTESMTDSNKCLLCLFYKKDLQT